MNKVFCLVKTSICDDGIYILLSIHSTEEGAKKAALSLQEWESFRIEEHELLET